MKTPGDQNEAFSRDGFTIIESVYSRAEVTSILAAIAEADKENAAFRKTTDLFAIRNFLREVPACINLIFTTRFKAIISNYFGKDFFVAKSIYFDKPIQSNWFVAYHQDLTIAVKDKLSVAGFEKWTRKENSFAVQPPLSLLEDNFTVRIHLDDTNEENGALKVVPRSHRKGINRPDLIDWKNERETICSVPMGGLMIMKPLLLHASNRSTNDKRRRVIHLEFSRQELPNGLEWAEKVSSIDSASEPCL